MIQQRALVRAAVALFLPFVTEAWQIYMLIFLLQSASAGFTPAFQATIPDVLPDEKDYTRALSLSRLAYDLESVASPMLAAALLGVIPFHGLFGGTVVGFLASAALVLSVAAASIVAKVTRDRLMERVGLAHPGYGFERHMGYSVPEHFRALDALGPCIHHRRSFAPVAEKYAPAEGEVVQPNLLPL